MGNSNHKSKQSIKPSIKPVKLSTNIKGTISEYQEVVNWSKAGYWVAKSCDPQCPFDLVVVSPDGYISTLNNNNTLFFDEVLVSNGKGQNYGIDFTLEKYLSDGYYCMLSGSIFNSTYTANDNIERNTRFNKNYIFNIMAGKEWKIGNKNILSANVRINYLGGNRKESIDYDASYKKQDVVHGETDQVISFNDKFKNLPIVSLTLSYRINNEKYSSVWSLQILNLTGTEEYSHDYYNLKTKKMNTKYDGIVIPTLSYRIEF